MVRDWTKDYFHEKYECYCDMVYRICMLYLKNESDARDGLQDIFLKMWEKQPVFENASHEKAWLISTTKHYCLDVLKSSWHKKRVALDINREIECLRMLEQRRIDGILIVGVNLPVQHLTDLNIRVPVVLLERDSGDSRFDSVKIDNYSGAYAAVDYLIEKGYEGIAHIRGNQASMMAVQRKEAYQAALREHGYEPVKEYEVDGHYTLEGGYSAMERLMQLKEPPRAVFCANDMSAIGALRYLSQNGYKVPQDMALVGYDDITVASLVTPALTTVRQPVMELAKIGTQILLERMEMKEGDTYSPKSVVLKSELLVRDST